MNDRTSMTDVITTHTHTHIEIRTRRNRQTDRQTDVERTGINRHRLVEGVRKFAPPGHVPMKTTIADIGHGLRLGLYS